MTWWSSADRPWQMECLLRRQRTNISGECLLPVTQSLTLQNKTKAVVQTARNLL